VPPRLVTESPNPSLNDPAAWLELEYRWLHFKRLMDESEDVFLALAAFNLLTLLQSPSCDESGGFLEELKNAENTPFPLT
jgi:hypothetical protein